MKKGILRKKQNVSIESEKKILLMQTRSKIPRYFISEQKLSVELHSLTESEQTSNN